MGRYRIWQRITLIVTLLVVAVSVHVLLLRKVGGTAALLTIKIVDEQGRAIEGAQVRAWALGSDSGHGLWDEKEHGPPPVERTNASGKARLTYPVFHHERIPVWTVSVKVQHPEFCRNTEHLRLGAPWDLPPKLTLKRGTRLRIRPMTSDGKTIASRCFLLFDGQDYRDPLSHQESDGWVLTEPLPKEHRTLYVVHVPESGEPIFSEPYRWDPEDVSTYKAEITLRPGPTVAGRLNDSVPRPVQNGFVIYAATIPQSTEPAWRSWEGRAEVSEDGSFEIPSLPPGGDVQLLAMCDGFLSEKPTNEEIMQIQHAYPGGSNSASYDAAPMLMPLTAAVNNVVLNMRPTHQLTVKVLDPDRKPIEGATACLSPNQFFFGVGSTLVGNSRSTADLLFSHQYDRFHPKYFEVPTDSEGVAVFKNVPEGKQRLSIFDSRWELRISRNRRVVTVFVDGDTQWAVRLQPKGAQTQTGRSPIIRWLNTKVQKLPKWP